MSASGLIGCAKEEARSEQDIRDELNEKYVITQEKAVDFVRRSVSSTGLAMSSITIGETFTALGESGMPTIHVVNYESGSQGGWIMVSGDQRIMPLLAYGSDEPLSEEVVEQDGISDSYSAYGAVVEGMRMGVYDSSISPYDIEARPQPCESDADNPSGGNCPPNPPPLRCGDRRGPVDETIGPLITTTWRQNCPYNDRLFHPICRDECDSRRSLVGCGAVAFAQVVRFWEDAGGTMFDWPNIDDAYFGNVPASRTLAQQQGNVADLMNMSVNRLRSAKSCNNTATLPINILRGFRELEYIGSGREIDYNVGVIESEIREGRPVIMHGRRRIHANWHIWVIDGFRVRTNGWCMPQRWNRMNWGWGGRGNGMYLTTDFLPKENNNGPAGVANGDVLDTDRNYRKYQKIIVGISPE